MGVHPFLLVIVALGLMLISTRQVETWKRLAAIGGSVLLLLVAMTSLGAGAGRVFRILGAEDGWGIIWHNRDVVGDYLGPLLLAFVILGAIGAVLALIALSPGEKTERVTRVLLIGVIGAIFGAFLATAVVALGFGGNQQRGVYVAAAEQVRVIDGDSLAIGDVALRLAGIDAPERDQDCLAGTVRTPCGGEAAQRLQSLIDEGVVVCRGPVAPPDAREEGSGRPLAVCVAHKRGQDYDVARRLAAQGFAVEANGLAGEYANDVAAAREARLGLWALCTPRPDIWRRNHVSFERNGALPNRAEERIGCLDRR